MNPGRVRQLSHQHSHPVVTLVTNKRKGKGKVILFNCIRRGIQSLACDFHSIKDPNPAGERNRTRMKDGLEATGGQLSFSLFPQRLLNVMT